MCRETNSVPLSVDAKSGAGGAGRSVHRSSAVHRKRQLSRVPCKHIRGRLCDQRRDDECRHLDQEVTSETIFASRWCTTSRTSRSLVLHPHDALLRAGRRAWSGHADLCEAYRHHRPMVERSITCLIGAEGRCRNLRHHGIEANDWRLHTRTAALNLRRLLDLGLTRSSTLGSSPDRLTATTDDGTS